MGTDSFLIIITWAGIALFLIGIGLHNGRKQEAQRSLIFQPGHEEYAELYVGAVAAIEAEMDEWISKK